MNAHNKTQLTHARINCALKDSSCDSPLSKMLKFTILALNASSSSTKVLKFPHNKDDSIFTHNSSTIYSSRITSDSHTHKDEHMHDFTHRFALIFQSTLDSAHSRSKRSFKACNGDECKVFLKNIQIFKRKESSKNVFDPKGKITCVGAKANLPEGASTRSRKYLVGIGRVLGELACFNSPMVVDHCLFKYNILFEDDEITPSDVPSGVDHESSVVLDSYTLYSNPLWCEDCPPKDRNLFLEDESTLVGKECDEEEGGVGFPMKILARNWKIKMFLKNIQIFKRKESSKNVFDPKGKITCVGAKANLPEGASTRSRKYLVGIGRVLGELACFNSPMVVDHCLFKYNILFEDDEITPSDVPSGVDHESSVVLDSYTLYSNPLWCEDCPPKDRNLFLEDESTLVGKEHDEKEGGICFPITSSSWCVSILNGMTNDFEPISSHTFENTLDEFDLRDTFLYYLFTYDDAHAFELSMLLEVKSAKRAKGGVLNPSSWNPFPFDPGSELNCGTCVVMLGQDDKYHLDGSVDTFPYDGKSVLRIYNPLEEPTLCMGKGSFLNPFLYSCFEYDLVDRTFNRGRSSLLREGEVYFKFAMMSLSVPSYDVMSARILEPSCDLTYRNTLDVPSVHDTFLYYLFAYDDTHVCVGTIFHINSGINGVNESLFDSMLYCFFPFDPGVGLNYDGYGSNTLFLSCDSYLVLLFDHM
uniref:Uncharacterized protein n=1 Tax=Solanum tuberosum TaxID=4113 RepID=M1DG64_SOLTU